jgi:hypothetical protein
LATSTKKSKTGRSREGSSPDGARDQSFASPLLVASSQEAPFVVPAYASPHTERQLLASPRPACEEVNDTPREVLVVSDEETAPPTSSPSPGSYVPAMTGRDAPNAIARTKDVQNFLPSASPKPCDTGDDLTYHLDVLRNGRREVQRMTIPTSRAMYDHGFWVVLKQCWDMKITGSLKVLTPGGLTDIETNEDWVMALRQVADDVTMDGMVRIRVDLV